MRERILTIRLMEMAEKAPDCTTKLGIVVTERRNTASQMENKP